MDEYRQPDAINEMLAGKSFRGVHATGLGDDIVLRRDGERAKLAYEKAVELIRLAESEQGLWLAIGEAGLLWPRLMAGGNSSSESE